MNIQKYRWGNRFICGSTRQGKSTAEVIEIIALNYSLNPRLLLALLEFRGSGLTDPFPSEQLQTYPLGHVD